MLCSLYKETDSLVGGAGFSADDEIKDLTGNGGELVVSEAGVTDTRLLDSDIELLLPRERIR